MFGGRFTSSCGLLGIDIGSRSMKMLQLRRQGSHLAVVGAAEALLSDQGSRVRSQVSGKDPDGDTPSPDGRHGTPDASPLGERLRAIFTSGGFTGRRCVVSLPRSDLFVQAIRLPKMPEAELRQAARWEAAERFGLDPEASEVDIIRTGASSGAGAAGSSAATAAMGGSEGREEVLVIAAPHAVIHARLTPILEAGLRPVAIDTHFCALARIFSRQFRRESDRKHVRVVLEVGASGSTVLILRGSEIAFCKPIMIGGCAFNQAVAEHLQLDLPAAAELRAARTLSALRGAGSAGRPGAENEEPAGAAAAPDPATDRAIYEATRPLMGELVKDVSLCLRYYGVTFRGTPAYQIILTGGECLEPHLAHMLLSTCKLPVVFDDEPETLARLLPGIGSILHRMPGPPTQWAIAAGLSIRNLEPVDAAKEPRSEVRSAEPEGRGPKTAGAAIGGRKPGAMNAEAARGLRPLTSAKEAA